MIVTFCGVGGTGKTTTAEALQRLRTDAILVPSIVRSYYASRGVASEIEYLKLPAEGRFDFQLGLLSHYMQELRRVSDCYPRDRLLMLDRSVFDHCAYAIYAAPDIGQAHLDAVLLHTRQFAELSPRVYYFPYPVPWVGDIIDGFRATAVGKNWLLNSAMWWLLSHYHPKFNTVPITTPEERAEFIEGTL